MAFDPSVISDIGNSAPDIVGGISKGFALKDMVDQNQLNKLKLMGAKQEQSDTSTARKILSSSDLSTDKGIAEASEKLNKSGMADKAMSLRKYGQEVASGQLDQQIKTIELHSAAQGLITSQVDGIWQQATAMKNEKTPDGRPRYTDAAVNAFINGQVPAAISRVQTDDSIPDPVKKMALGAIQQVTAKTGSQLTYDQLTAFERSTKQGQEQWKAHLEEVRGNATMANQADEMRHRKVEEGQGQQRVDIAKKNSGDFGGENGELLAAFTDAGVTLPQGLRSKQVLAGTLTALRERHPGMSADEIAQGVKDGSISMGVAKTEGSVLGRREAAILPVEKSITKPGGFLDQAEQAVKEVDFSKLKAAGSFEKWSKDQLSDPSLAAYKAAVAELRAEYSIVLSKGGQVTDAARHESEKVIPDLITKDQFKRIKNVVLKGIESSKSGVEESIGDITGKPSGTATPASGGGDLAAAAAAELARRQKGGS